MNHILKKVIQCVVSFFCVLGMVSTTGKSINAEGEASNPYAGTIQINDDNSFIITFEDDHSLDSIIQNSKLYLDFANNDITIASFVLKGGIKNDGNKTLTFDNRILSCGGGYVPKGSYSVSLRQESNTQETITWKLKGTDEDGKVTLDHDINIKWTL